MIWTAVGVKFFPFCALCPRSSRVPTKVWNAKNGVCRNVLRAYANGCEPQTAKMANLWAFIEKGSGAFMIRFNLDYVCLCSGPHFEIKRFTRGSILVAWRSTKKMQKVRGSATFYTGTGFRPLGPAASKRRGDPLGRILGRHVLYNIGGTKRSNTLISAKKQVLLLGRLGKLQPYWNYQWIGIPQRIQIFVTENSEVERV